MKKSSLRICSLLLVLFIFMSVPVYAASRASDQLMGYSLHATPIGNGTIEASFSVTGVERMAKIGAQSVSFYEYINNRWMMVAYYNQDDTNMIRTDTNRCTAAAYYHGNSGSEYKVVITIFAEDYSGGSDSRTQTFYVTA